jgi:hypothetical protein
MKTPCDILFEQHRDANSKLDTIRAEVVNQCRDGRRASVRSPYSGGIADVALLFWRELIMPSRRIWAGLAAAWVLILAVNLALRDPAQPATITKASVPAIMSFQEQQKLLNALLADRSLPGDVDRPKAFLPRPRSERVAVAMI